MTRVTIEKSDFPWVVTIDFQRGVTHPMRTEMYKWLAENVGRDNFIPDDRTHYAMIFRLAREEDAMLLKMRYEGS